MVRQLFLSLLSRARHHLQDRVTALSFILKQIVSFAVYTSAVAWLAAFLYGTFYYYYIPVVVNVYHVHFHFSVCEDGVSICSFPVYNVSLVMEDDEEVFMRGQGYKMVLELEAPETPVNRDLGMFMVDLHLYNRKGETVKSSSRIVSATLQYQSELLRVMETIVFSPLLIFGYMNQKQMINVELFSSYIDNPFNPSVGAVVEIQNKHLQIYGAWLKIYAEFIGIRYFLFYWPITSALVGFCWNFILITFIILLSWYNWSTEGGGDDKPWKGKKKRATEKDNKDTEPKDIPEAHIPDVEDVLAMGGGGGGHNPIQDEDIGLRLRQPHPYAT